ncbi:MAG: flippase-like domain-containing protein [Bacteroidetes bacterium]|nr:flippase-like domain-containing protein [Bacteroidota bacterium]
MKNRLFQLLLGALISAVTLYAAFYGMDLSTITNILSSVNWWWLVPTTVVMVLSHYVRAWRWRLFFGHDAESDRLYPYFSSTMVGYAVNNALPRGGELAKAIYLGRMTNRSQTHVLGTVVLERLIDSLILLVVFGLSMLWFSEDIDRHFPGLGVGAGVLTVSLVGMLLVLTLLPVEKSKVLIHWFTRWLGSRLSAKIGDLSGRFLEGVSALRNGHFLPAILVSSLLIFLLYIAGTWLPMFAFPFQQSANLGFPAGMAVMAIAAIGMVIPSPGGTGTYHWFCSMALIQIFGVNQAEAVSFATLVHLLNLGFSTLAGAGCFLFDQAHRTTGPVESA